MPILLVRHATAGKRSAWQGDDRLRPLDKRGRRQAEGLVAQLGRFEPERVLSSPYLRCTQTIEPLAGELGLTVEAADELSEGAGRERALRLLRRLGETTAVLCTHGDVLEELVGEEGKKGSTWVLSVDGERVTPLERIPPPA
jgi:8-oxo-(d)GTP phosphatase